MHLYVFVSSALPVISTVEAVRPGPHTSRFSNVHHKLVSHTMLRDNFIRYLEVPRSFIHLAIDPIAVLDQSAIKKTIFQELLWAMRSVKI